MRQLEKHLIDQVERHRWFFWHRLRWHAVSGFLPRDRPFRLLDIGAGAGVLGHCLARDFANGQYFFFEPLESLAEHLAATFGPNRDVRDPKRYAEMDVVTLLDVLEHREDDLAFLQDLAARLRPGCTLIITVPALPSLWSAWDELLGHHRRYTRGALGRVLRACRLEIVVQHYLFPELLPLAYLRKCMSPAQGGAAAEGRSEFPAVPPLVNAGLYALGRIIFPLSRLAPAGTSLFAVTRLPQHGVEGRKCRA